MRVPSLLLLLTAFVFSGCSLLDIFDTSIPNNDLGEAPPSLQYAHPNMDLYFTFDLGSYCWSYTDMGICADAMPPEYTEAQHIAVNSTMELVFAEPIPSTVSLSLYPGSNLLGTMAISVEAIIDQAGHIALTLPENLDGLYVLAVFAMWDSGDAFYTLPIKLED